MGQSIALERFRGSHIELARFSVLGFAENDYGRELKRAQEQADYALHARAGLTPHLPRTPSRVCIDREHDIGKVSQPKCRAHAPSQLSER